MLTVDSKGGFSGTDVIVCMVCWDGYGLIGTDRYMTIVKELGLRPSSVFSKDVSLGAKKAPRPQLH